MLAALLAGPFALASPALAAQGEEAPASPASPVALAELSIEELAQIEVTSASKRAEPLSGAAAALYVITGEEILRSPATSLPQLLRQAPNLQVQRLDSRQFAISARGFNGVETANKLLALIDGRTIYTPLASTIFWELHSPMIEDLAQIEVISGPGGTLYGPNAVNGVINIRSRSAYDSAGVLARATVAANEQTAALRYGGSIGDAGAFRVYANYFHRADAPDNSSPDVDDEYEGVQGGFRADFGTGDSVFTVQGDIFDANSPLLPGDGENGHNLLARYSNRLSDNASFQVQAYYDKFERQVTLVNDALETFDVEAQINGSFGRHELVAGGGVRTTRDKFVNNLNGFVLDPESRRLWMVNGFVQDRFALTDRLSLTAGVKLEESSFTGLQVLPNIRLAWQPNDRHLWWGAVSRAVRTPSRIDRQLVFLPLLAQATGFKTEKLTAIEAGYRGQPTDSTTLSVSLFFNQYDDLRTTEFAPGGVLPIRLMNSLRGHSYGVEAWATQQLAPWWRVRLGLATLGKDFEVRSGRTDLAGRNSLGNDPDYKLQLRSQMDLSPTVEFDFGMRAIDDLDAPEVSGFVEADARLGWQVSKAVELYVAGSNLLHENHQESGDAGRGQLVERSIHAGTRLRF
jgi:iron complex outermembrane receptor protein